MLARAPLDASAVAADPRERGCGLCACVTLVRDVPTRSCTGNSATVKKTINSNKHRLQLRTRVLRKGFYLPGQPNKPLPEPFLWLEDSPLFIDAGQVDRFYDAIARPQSKEGVTTLDVNEETIETIKKKLELEAGVTTEAFAALLIPIFSFIKPSIKVSGGGEKTSQDSHGKTLSIELHPISTPQRQLEQLTLHYLFKHPDRLWFVAHPGDQTDWRTPEAISKVPRALVFLDLPGQEEARNRKTPETKIIPAAAEFANGKIVPLYQSLVAENGERPPRSPETATSATELQSKRKEYWNWFDKHYSAVRAMITVEEAASQNGRIQWIDYRLPITAQGDTLHLHVCPSSAFDTGVLAYNFIKRGFKHGLRLVGTLKSEPDMNVLAVYEK